MRIKDFQSTSIWIGAYPNAGALVKSIPNYHSDYGVIVELQEYEKEKNRIVILKKDSAIYVINMEYPNEQWQHVPAYIKDGAEIIYDGREKTITKENREQAIEDSLKRTSSLPDGCVPMYAAYVPVIYRTKGGSDKDDKEQ